MPQVVVVAAVPSPFLIGIWIVILFTSLVGFVTVQHTHTLSLLSLFAYSSTAHDFISTATNGGQSPPAEKTSGCCTKENGEAGNEN